MNRIIIITIVLLSAVVAFADKKRTIRNIDTGESFEMTVPDGFKMYSYNVNWLDSIPYLKEHARRGEPWAYEALAECYRCGKGGVKRSFFTSLCFYELSGKDAQDIIEEIKTIDNDDPYVVFSRMIDYIEKKGYKSIECAIDTLHAAGYHSADILLSFKHKPHKREIVEYVIDKNTDSDACVFAAAGLKLNETADSTTIATDWALPLLLEKIPYFYSLIGVKAYEKTVKSDSSDGYAKDATEEDVNNRHKAVENFIKADEQAMLTKQGARLLYHYLTCDSTSTWVNFSEEDLSRLQVLAEIDE